MLVLLALAVIGHHLVDQLVLLFADACARHSKFILYQTVDTIVVLSGAENPGFHIEFLDYVKISQIQVVFDV